MQLEPHFPAPKGPADLQYKNASLSAKRAWRIRHWTVLTFSSPAAPSGSRLQTSMHCSKERYCSYLPLQLLITASQYVSHVPACCGTSPVPALLMPPSMPGSSFGTPPSALLELPAE